MQEVIRIEPRASSAWSVLAQCYEDMQQKDRALQLRIMAAHLIHDAEEWDRLAQESRLVLISSIPPSFTYGSLLQKSRFSPASTLLLSQGVQSGSKQR